MVVPGRSEDKLWKAATNKLPGAQGAPIYCHHNLSYLAKSCHIMSYIVISTSFITTTISPKLVPGTSMGRQGTALASSMGRPTTGEPPTAVAAAADDDDVDVDDAAADDSYDNDNDDRDGSIDDHNDTLPENMTIVRCFSDVPRNPL